MNAKYLEVGKGLHKLSYYIGSFWLYMQPAAWSRPRLKRLFSNLSDDEIRAIKQRVDFYIRLKPCHVESFEMRVGDFKYPFGQEKKWSTYFFDMYPALRYFNPDLRFNHLFGDIDFETAAPTIVKSRPVAGEQSDSVVLRLDSVRHFRFIKDHIPFRDKKNMIVSRNVVRQPHRILFLEKTYGDPMCDVGQVNTDTEHPEWIKPFMTVQDQLNYKFIACIEGHDVATNLKWVMSSNSLAVMPKPKFETWYMEGNLKAGVHYVEVKDDYSDLHEQMQHYIYNPEEAEQIIENAHAWVRQFRNKKIERLTQIAVLGEYFSRTGQSELNKSWEEARPY